MPNAIVAEVEARLAAAGDAESAAQQQRYMKSAMRFHGVPNATLKSEARRIWKEHPELAHDGAMALVRALWSTEWWDLRSVAIVLLGLRAKKILGPADLEFLVGLCRDAACWAHVDEIATHLVGAVLAKHPEERERLRVWARDERSFWVRRTALLGQLPELRAGGGDFALFEDIAVPMLEEKEFFIRKAIGWVLRDVSKKRPALVRGFVERHGERMSGLSRREATKYL
jgi:3-methyladenine DNA glycosylase AlkD